MGLCPRCGTKPPEGQVTCLACLDRRRTEYRDSQRRAVRKYAASHPREPVPKKPRQVKERAAKPNYYQKRRTELIARYGGACVCCGEDYAPYLELDHVDGGGLAERERS